MVFFLCVCDFLQRYLATELLEWKEEKARLINR